MVDRSLAAIKAAPVGRLSQEAPPPDPNDTIGNQAVKSLYVFNRGDYSTASEGQSIHNNRKSILLCRWNKQGPVDSSSLLRDVTKSEIAEYALATARSERPTRRNIPL